MHGHNGTENSNGPRGRFAMSRGFKILLIGFVLGFELLAYLQWNPYPHGETVDVAYRRKERMAAQLDYYQHSSPATKARFDEEMRLIRRLKPRDNMIGQAVPIADEVPF